MKKVEKKVYTNKELRDTLESYNLNDDTIDSIDVSVNIKKSATYESNVDFVDLEYKGYKYEVLGFLREKYSDPECTNDDDEPFTSISSLLDVIEDNELNTLDYKLIGSVNGESEDWWPLNHLNSESNPVNWIDETPDNIKSEFDKNFKENDYRDVVYEGNESYNGDGGVFFNEFNNITSLHIDIITQETNYNIKWINKKNDKELEKQDYESLRDELLEKYKNQVKINWVPDDLDDNQEK